MAPPEVELRHQGVAVEPLALRDGVVGVLHGQLGERRRSPQKEVLIESRQLADQNAQRPAVGDDVVDGEGEDPLIGREPQQNCPQQRAAGQTERAAHRGQGERPPGGPALRLRQMSEIDDRQRERPSRADPLHRSALDRRERGAQALVAGDDPGQRPCQAGLVEWTLEPDGANHSRCWA